jgi:hypothetical protein
MPVEVRELVIKATVDSDEKGAASPASDDQTSGNEELIKLCVDKVMEILKERNGR